MVKDFKKALEVLDASKLFQSKAFQEGAKACRDRTLRMNNDGRAYYWVKKLIKPVDYNEYYKWDSTYYKLGEVMTGRIVAGYWLGFLASEITTECQMMTNEELKSLNYYRKSRNIYPLVFDDETSNSNSALKQLNSDAKDFDRQNDMEEIDASKIPF